MHTSLPHGSMFPLPTNIPKNMLLRRNGCYFSMRKAKSRPATFVQQRMSTSEMPPPSSTPMPLWRMPSLQIYLLEGVERLTSFS
eukprot:03522_4